MYVSVFIMPHVDIELEDNKQFILNIPRIIYLSKMNNACVEMITSNKISCYITKRTSELPWVAEHIVLST